LCEAFPVPSLGGWRWSPALLIVSLVQFAGRKAEHARVRAALEAVVLASAGLVMAAAIPLAKVVVVHTVTLLIAVISVGLLLKTKLDTLWIIIAAALTKYLVSMVRLLLAASA